MEIRTERVVVTTSASGAFTGASDASGPLLMHIVYAADAAGAALSGAADLSVTDTLTGMPLFLTSNFGSSDQKVYTPRRFVNDSATGVESTTVMDYQAVNPSGLTISITGATAASQTATLWMVFG